MGSEFYSFGPYSKHLSRRKRLQLLSPNLGEEVQVEGVRSAVLCGCEDRALQHYMHYGVISSKVLGLKVEG